MGMAGQFAPIPQVGPNANFAPLAFSGAVAGYSAPASAGATPGLHPCIVYPYGMSMQDWCDAFVLAMAHAIPLPQFDGDFERWSAQITHEPKLQQYQLPQRRDDWVKWAQETNDALGGAQ